MMTLPCSPLLAHIGTWNDLIRLMKPIHIITRPAKGTIWALQMASPSKDLAGMWCSGFRPKTAPNMWWKSSHISQIWKEWPESLWIDGKLGLVFNWYIRLRNHDLISYKRRMKESSSCKKGRESCTKKKEYLIGQIWKLIFSADDQIQYTKSS